LRSHFWLKDISHIPQGKAFNTFSPDPRLFCSDEI
jgi:hypothetical protein